MSIFKKRPTQIMSLGKKKSLIMIKVTSVTSPVPVISPGDDSPERKTSHGWPDLPELPSHCRSDLPWR